MAWKFPITPPQDGDDESQAPGTSSRSILGTDPITGATRRLFVDSNHYLWTSVKNLPLTYPVTGPLTDTELRATPVPITGTLTANQGTSPWIISGTVSTSAGTGLSTVTRIAVNNTSAVTLSLLNAAKIQVILYNEGGTLFVKFGSNASSTSFTYTMTPDSTLEITGYYGLITARKLTGSTFVDVTEVGI